MKWIYHERVTSAEAMTNLSKVLRANLANVTSDTLPRVMRTSISGDGTVKWIIETQPGGAVETVLIPDG